MYKYLPTLQCLDDPSMLSFYGSMFTQESRGVSFEVIKCVGKPHCKNETEINEFLANKNVVVIYNQQMYNPAGYGENMVQKTLKINYIDMQNTAKTEITYMDLWQETIESEERFLNPGWFGPRGETLYRLEPSKTTG